MDRLLLKNRAAIPFDDLPKISYQALGDIAVGCLCAALRPVALFGVPEERHAESVRIVALFADDAQGTLAVTSVSAQRGATVPSLTPSIPAFHLFERQLWEEFGIVPEGHPWLKPVRYPHDGHPPRRIEEGYRYFAMKGEESHEVAVGPVHAGVIEPGHFRFLCDGERVNHLEIQLGYQHRGVERLFREGPLAAKSTLAESVSGDAAVAHATAYAGLVEALGDTVIPRRASVIRAIGLELERAGIHLGDLSALCNDIGYLPGTQLFAVMRTDIINTSLVLCGSRFGRGLLTPGGVNYDIDEKKKERIIATVRRIRDNAGLLAASIFDNQSVLARFEKTGSVDTATARAVGLVGPAGRASGLTCDIRLTHPTDAYADHPFMKTILQNGEGKAAVSGDVYARAFVRHQEIQDSLRYILELLERLDAARDGIIAPVAPPRPDMIAFSLTEGWRGETLHAAVTGGDGGTRRYYIKDASFHNWFGLALAVRDNGVSDFPLCNKSFNLSYCGFDL
ncbi:MAG TPA: NADH-quinone oxidoreductase subunit C [bacterium]|nr:NADH-quinone oxidoreductase subunit C [bacterium]